LSSWGTAVVFGKVKIPNRLADGLGGVSCRGGKGEAGMVEKEGGVDLKKKTANTSPDLEKEVGWGLWLVFLNV